MNHSPSPPEPDSEDRFVDALLHERARLGDSVEDAELVGRILVETVRRPGTEPVSPRAAAADHDRRFWVTGAAAAAALVALAATVLAVLPFGNRDRHSEEIRLIVRYAAPSESGIESTLAEAKPPLATARPYDGLVDLVAPPASPVPRSSLSADLLELQTVFGRSVENFPERPLRQERFDIAAEQTAEFGGERVYSGRVRLTGRGFEIEAERVSLPLTPTPGDLTTAPITASAVVVRQETPRRVARAERLEFDPVTGAFILSGVRDFETAEGRLTSLGRDDRLILTADSFAIRNVSAEAGEAVKYANPLPLRPE